MEATGNAMNELQENTPKGCLGCCRMRRRKSSAKEEDFEKKMPPNGFIVMVRSVSVLCSFVITNTREGESAFAICEMRKSCSGGD